MSKNPSRKSDELILETLKSDINRVDEILHQLPMLRRYGDDAAAIQEAQKILARVKEQL